MVALALEERGIDVVSVGNGEAAVRRIPDLSPDLVLADVFMPVRNGYEVCEFVKKDERFSHVPVILLVGAFDPLDEKEARRVGADGVLKKPFVPPDPLIAMVTSALEKNPKVAAEISNARETAPAPPPPHPAPTLVEAPARVQPKPLPDFPEPTPEEAALIYGFGKGRGADRDDAPPKPVTTTDQDEEQDELDAAMTASDWRRSAANFEVPAELGDKPAFAADEDFRHEMFPSERDVPPKHIRVADEEKIAALAADEPIERADDFEQKFVEHEQAGAMPQAAEGEPQSQVAEKPLAKAPEAHSEPTPAAPRTPPVPATTPQPAGWMDAGTPAASEYENGGWMSKVFGSAGQASASQKQDATDRSARATVPSAKSNEAPAPKERASTKQVESSSEPGKAAAESWFAPPPPPVLKPPVESPLADAPQQSDKRSFVGGSDAMLEPDDRGKRSGAYAASEPVQLSSDVEPPRGDGYAQFFAADANKASAEKTDGGAASREEFSSLVSAPSDASAGAIGSSERIPTIPPPSREALRDIPFLTPPPPSPLEVGSGRGQDAPSVDMVVAKVLEKLEPQLHDLLKQSVLKPLVENLLQNEGAKQEK